MKKELNITKEEFLGAKNYIFTIANITSQGITGWNFYLLNKNGTIKKVTGGRAWNAKKGYYHETAYGTDRKLEILLSIASELGLNFHDVKQEKIIFL
ncbi:MAG: hypothetical protein ACO2PO_02270 [Candidatus Calescibacterium sp.]